MLLTEFSPLAAIATTPTSAQRLQPLTQAAGATLWVPESLSKHEGGQPPRTAGDAIRVTQGGDAHATRQVYTGSLKDHLATLWNTHQGFIFCLATGAVVRLIAPLLQHKSCDPAVVVVDETGQFVISLCSGHQGGADQLARLIALQIGATPVLTGASAGLGLPAVDMLGVPFGWNRGEGDWTGVSASVARGEPVQVIQEAGSTLWQAHLPKGHPFHFGFPEWEPGTGDKEGRGQDNRGNQELSASAFTSVHNSVSTQNSGRALFQGPDKTQNSPQARIWISPTHRRFSSESDLPEVQWHPRVLWVGVGCERGTSRQLIETAIQQVCRSNNLALGAIAGIATIDLKADEVGLVELCRDRNWPLRTFRAEVLADVTVPNPSAIVKAEVGTPSVAEAAALQASGCQSLLVAKQIFRSDPPLTPGTQGGERIPSPRTAGHAIRVTQGGARGGKAVTVAIAQAEQEYTGRTGCLLLVGTGPGQLDQMTPAAQTAVTQADAVIGYSLYIDLIAPLLGSGQIVEALPITQERLRALRAIELAQWGLDVAVVSSGDCGIYGMAGLVLEELQTKGWDGKTPSVQVFPGITALQAAASRVGAPLMHDFCAISLSDLLTPWDVIEKRLTAAAQADFVTAIYNPRSQTRTQQIAIARAIFLQYRAPNTPVALVRSAYRQDEQITLTTLSQLLDAPIDMLTTVLIGNSSTRTHADWMITPRGYLGFGTPSDPLNPPPV